MMKCPNCKRSIVPHFDGYHIRRYGMCQDCWEQKLKESKK